MLCGMAPCQLQTEDNHAAFAASFGILIFGGGKKARRRGQGLMRSLREAAGPAALLERPLGSGHRGAFCSLDHPSAAARAAARSRAASLQDVATGRWAEAAASGGRGGEGPAPRPSWLGPFLAGLCLRSPKYLFSAFRCGRAFNADGGAGPGGVLRDRLGREWLVVFGGLRGRGFLSFPKATIQFCGDLACQARVSGTTKPGHWVPWWAAWRTGRTVPVDPGRGEVFRDLQRQLPAGNGGSCKEAFVSFALCSAWAFWGQVPGLKAERGARGDCVSLRIGRRPCVAPSQAHAEVPSHADRAEAPQWPDGTRKGSVKERKASQSSESGGMEGSSSARNFHHQHFRRAFARPSTLAVVGGHNFMVRPGGPAWRGWARVPRVLRQADLGLCPSQFRHRSRRRWIGG